MGSASATVYGDPKPQPRPRAFSRGGKARMYDVGTAEGWKAVVAAALESQRPAEPIAGGVRVDLTFRFARPKGHFRTGRNAHLLRDAAPEDHTGRPDVDNLGKAVLDALTAVGWWRDDSQIIHLNVVKLWCAPGERPGASVDIYWWSDVEVGERTAAREEA